MLVSDGFINLDRAQRDVQIFKDVQPAEQDKRLVIGNFDILDFDCFHEGLALQHRMSIVSPQLY